MENTTIIYHINNNTNHVNEMVRLKRLVDKGDITKNEAIMLFQNYLETNKGKRAKPVEFPYKRSA